jgi:uncharacterized protein (TIGR02271 family)
MERHDTQYDRAREHFDEAGRPCSCESPDAHAVRSATPRLEADWSVAEEPRRFELAEEELVAHRELRERGEVQVRTRVEEVPARLEVDAYREEVEIDRVPVSEIVSERVAPWEEDGVLVVPVYEEQLVVVKRLVMKEQLRIRRAGVTERQLFEDTLRRERLEIDDPNETGLVVERYPIDHDDARGREDGEGLLGKVKRALF